MSAKNEFIEYVERLMNETNVPMSKEANLYWEALVNGEDKTEKPLFTDNGKIILKYMQDNQDTVMWKSKDIAEGILISARGVSGAMRKLVTDGFVEKIGKDPIIYTLTEKGKNIQID